MAKRLFISIWLFILCVSAFSQTSGGDTEEIKTIAGTLTINKAPHAEADSATFHVKLNGREFDQLYGPRYTYYEDSKDTVGATRIIVEDFAGGFSDPPSVMLYDFRKKNPDISNVSGHLDVDGVKWTSKAVFLSENGKWYKFFNGKLTRGGPPKGLLRQSN
ncbi:hypothetical protein [Paraburkholderia caballeronis]|uniref:hypothetical protein n=1 Tax=Paraburkholderia caballeronis TaxID=416943 RepID=UPI001FB90BFD|nr:hypothetical protein [Paraburkholderia caballeronis]